MSKKSIVIAGSMIALSLFVAVPAMAAGTMKQNRAVNAMSDKANIAHPSKKGTGMMVRRNMSFGTISAINGSSFTITSKKMVKTGTTTTTTNPITITVNTSATTVFKKDGTAATIGDLAVGQMVMVKGVKDVNNVIANATNVSIVTKPVTWTKTKISTGN
ncbi:hypothetical protein HY311_00175 [Candidatus Nomurabacteria bacterium]|nr:hypothetical protein [Candidatus Nomurabacteria bacterium]